MNEGRIHIIYIYFEPFPSGQTTHVLSLVSGLDRSRFSVHVLLPKSLESLVDTFERAGAQVEIANFSKFIWGKQAILKLHKLIKKFPGGIFHFHSQEAALLGRLIAKMAGARSILYTPQTIDIRRKEFQKIYIALEVVMARITEKIISVNEMDRNRLISWGIPREKIVTIYNGIDPGLFNFPEDRLALCRQLDLNPNQPIVMQIGRMSEQKAPFVFLSGASLVLKRNSNVQFVMLGDGPLFNRVHRRIINLGLQNQIKTPGSIPNAYRFIPIAEIISLTSNWEGTPYSILEGMACCKPIVATSVNGCSEIITHKKSGLLVPPMNPQKWAESVLELLEAPKTAKEYGIFGRLRIEKNFSITVMLRDIEELYMTVIKGQNI